DVAQGNAVEGDLGVVRGRLELAGRLLQGWAAVLGLCLGHYGLPPGFRLARSSGVRSLPSLARVMFTGGEPVPYPAPAAGEVVAGRDVGEATLGQDQPRAGTFGCEGQFHLGREARLTSEERGHRVGEPVRRLDRGQHPVLGERLEPGRM